MNWACAEIKPGENRENCLLKPTRRNGAQEEGGKTSPLRFAKMGQTRRMLEAQSDGVVFLERLSINLGTNVYGGK